MRHGRPSMIDHVWRERLALDDRLVRIGPDRSLLRAGVPARRPAPHRDRERETLRDRPAPSVGVRCPAA